MDRNVEREDIGRKGGASTGSTMHREGTKENLKEGWQDFKAKVRQKWSQLTDNDVDAYRGRSRDEFVGDVHGRVGGDRTHVERDVDTFARDSNYRW